MCIRQIFIQKCILEEMHNNSLAKKQIVVWINYSREVDTVIWDKAEENLFLWKMLHSYKYTALKTVQFKSEHDGDNNS